ncbi:MAG: hypothetical protein EBU49_13375 [Proteobacteria bacterium]|nr:hypothetical protein [Pseudomonadota bacterium]
MAFSLFCSSTLALLMSGCGSTLTSETKLRVRILGSLTQPTGATGTKSPMAQVYLFNNVSLQPADGSAAVDMYSGDPEELRIVSRPQEVWSTTDLTDYEDVSFSSATVKFDPLVVVIDQAGEEHSITLDTGDLVMSEPFSLTAGTEKVITVRASWGKTITPSDDTTPETTVSAPSFTLFLGETE